MCINWTNKELIIINIHGSTTKIIQQIRFPVLSSYLPSDRREMNTFLSPACPLAARFVQDRDLLQDQFPGVSSLASPPLQALTPVFFRLFLASSSHLFLGFPTDLLPSGIFITTFFSTFLLESFPHFLTTVIFLF